MMCIYDLCWLRLLEPLSYKKTLKRGFALVTTNGRPCTTVKQAVQHKTLDVQLADGTIRTQPLDHQYDVDFFGKMNKSNFIKQKYTLCFAPYPPQKLAFFLHCSFALHQ